LKFFYLWFRT